MPRRPQCPLCSGDLETRDVAPCAECGAWPHEIDHFLHGYRLQDEHGNDTPTVVHHTYHEFEVYPDLRLVLCDACRVSIVVHPPVVGPNVPRIELRLIRRIHQSTLGKDQYCPTCLSRLAFLSFIAEVRARYT